MIDSKLTPLEVADWLAVFGGNMAETAAALIRRQHEAIQKLREALDEINKHADGVGDQWCGAIAEQALKDTEEFDARR